MRSFADLSMKETLHECERHFQKILVAKEHLAKKMPLTEQEYKNLNDVDESFIDQLIFRF